MKPKPLNLEDIWWVNTPFGDFTKVVSLQSIKSACEFYLNEIIKERKKIRNKLKKNIPNEVKMNLSGMLLEIEFLEKKFKLAFKDVLGGRK